MRTVAPAFCAASSAAKSFEYGSSAYGPGTDKEMDRLDKKADKAKNGGGIIRRIFRKIKSFSNALFKSNIVNGNQFFDMLMQGEVVREIKHFSMIDQQILGSRNLLSQHLSYREISQDCQMQTEYIFSL